MAINYTHAKTHCVSLIALLAFALTCLAEPTEKGDSEEVLKELLQRVKGSSVGQSVEDLKLTLATEIENFSGADAEIEFIRGFKDFLFSEDWPDDAKWRGYLWDYPKLLSDALGRHSSRKMINVEGTPFKANQVKLSAVHKEMIICLEEFNKKIAANEGVRGDYRIEFKSQQIVKVAGFAKLHITDDLAMDVRNMCAFEGRRATVEDVKAVGVPDQLLNDVIERLGLDD